MSEPEWDAEEFLAAAEGMEASARLNESFANQCPRGCEDEQEFRERANDLRRVAAIYRLHAETPKGQLQ